MLYLTGNCNNIDEGNKDNSNNQIYYYNTEIDVSIWEHPLDYFFRNLINSKLKEKKKSCIVM